MKTRKRIYLYISLSLMIFIILYFVYTFRIKIIKITIPLLMAIIIAYLLKPLVIRLERKKIPRKWAILLIYLITVASFVGLVIFIVPHFINNTKELMNTLPDITMEYRNYFNNIVSTIRTSKWPDDIKDYIFKEIEKNTDIAENMVMETLKKTLLGIGKLATAAFDLLIAMIIAYYLIKDSNSFSKGAITLIPRQWRNGVIGCFREINGLLSNFIQGQIVTALIVGTMITISLFVIGVKYPLILGMLSGILNIIPYFGPVIGAIPAVAIALIESPTKAFWTIIVVVIIQQIDNAYISPKIIEGRLGLHPVTTILSVLVAGEFFGIVGMLVAVPVVAIIKVIIKRSIEAIV
ncbi:UNVERIFIED_CONTAM: putative PurR-regulated permease PerM [Acetivibrio alkalicellulosi]